MAKPTVAFASEERARENLDRKLKRLSALLELRALPADAPKSLNQFNAWEYSGASAEESFTSNAHETLSRHSDLKLATVALVAHAKRVLRPAPPPKELSVKRARERADLHLNIRQIAERHALKVMEENAGLRAEKLALQSQIESMVEELAAIRDAYEEELQKARIRNAELVRSASSKIKIIGKDV